MKENTKELCAMEAEGETNAMNRSSINDAVIGKYCIIRGRDFGVFAGTVEEVDGDRVLLKEARRLWFWDGAASLSQLALEGVKRPANCKFTATAPAPAPAPATAPALEISMVWKSIKSTVFLPSCIPFIRT